VLFFHDTVQAGITYVNFDDGTIGSSVLSDLNLSDGPANSSMTFSNGEATLGQSAAASYTASLVFNDFSGVAGDFEVEFTLPNPNEVDTLTGFAGIVVANPDFGTAVALCGVTGTGTTVTCGVDAGGLSGEPFAANSRASIKVARSGTRVDVFAAYDADATTASVAGDFHLVATNDDPARNGSVVLYIIGLDYAKAFSFTVDDFIIRGDTVSDYGPPPPGAEGEGEGEGEEEPAGEGIVVQFENSTEIDPFIFGQGFAGGDPRLAGGVFHDFYSNYGGGIWNPATKSMYAEPRAWIIEAGTTVSRFPGGTMANIYDWKTTIGPVESRPDYQFGIDEWLSTCEETGAEPLYTISYFTGDASDAADLVEYLNMPDSASYPWAQQRATNGHPAPYGVKYFEMGNETFNDAANDALENPYDYVTQFQAITAAMKAVDPTIQVGAVAFNDQPDSLWNDVVLAGLASDADYIIEHSYPVNLNYLAGPSPYSAAEVFDTLLSAPAHVERNYRKLNAHIGARTGEPMPLAITEFNTLLLGEEPTPYSKTLGNALYLADCLRVIMQPENNIFMSNVHNFINDYFGLTKTFPDPAGRRPAYYVYSMYKEHFGPERLDARVDPISSGTYSTEGRMDILPAAGAGSDLTLLSDNLAEGANWTIVPTEGVHVEEEGGVYSFSFDPGLSQYFGSYLIVNGTEGGAWYRFSGEVKFDDDKDGILLYLGDGRGYSDTRPFGASNEFDVSAGLWYERHVDVPTLADATSLQLAILRHPKAQGGNCQFRNWTLHRITPETLAATPYLSVNASRSADRNTVYLMVVNKHQSEAITVPVTVTDFTPEHLQSWVLTGPSMSSTNETNMSTVAPGNAVSGSVANGFHYTFAPHSLTAIELHGAPAAANDNDGDGLSDEEETALGTDPGNADTDGDGLDDGAEVLEHQTDPLQADSDGDGSPDGMEVALGSYPNNPAEALNFWKWLVPCLVGFVTIGALLHARSNAKASATTAMRL